MGCGQSCFAGDAATNEDVGNYQHKSKPAASPSSHHHHRTPTPRTKYEKKHDHHQRDDDDDGDEGEDDDGGRTAAAPTRFGSSPVAEAAAASSSTSSTANSAPVTSSSSSLTDSVTGTTSSSLSGVGVGARRTSGGGETSAPQPTAIIDWVLINANLPHDKNSVEQKRLRYAMFDKMDANHAGRLSLAEVSAGIKPMLARAVLPTATTRSSSSSSSSSRLLKLDVVIRTAFNTAKLAGLKAGVVGAGDDSGSFLEKREFRLLLLYLREHLEMCQLFAGMGGDGGGGGDDDLHLSLKEFTKAVPLLERWGDLSRADAHAAEHMFQLIDVHNSGLIMFEEFCAWALAQNLHAPDDDDDDGDDDETGE